MKKKCAVVLGASCDQVGYAGTFLMMLRRTNPHLADDYIVFYDEITEEDRRRLILLGATPKKYECPFKEGGVSSYFAASHYTLTVYSKYECLRLLSEYSTVIWMDYDMDVLSPLDELLVPAVGGIRAIVTNSISHSLTDEGVKQLGSDLMGIHSSLFALYDNLPDPEGIYNTCIERTRELDRLLRCPEQAVMAIVFAELGISVYPLDFRIYSSSTVESGLITPYIKVYHTFGKKKFWNGYDYAPWNTAREEWLAL